MWVDLVLHNSLDAEVELWDFTLVVKEAGIDDVTASREYLDIEVIDKITMKGRETRTVRRVFVRLYYLMKISRSQFKLGLCGREH